MQECEGGWRGRQGSGPAGPCHPQVMENSGTPQESSGRGAPVPGEWLLGGEWVGTGRGAPLGMTLTMVVKTSRRWHQRLPLKAESVGFGNRLDLVKEGSELVPGHYHEIAPPSGLEDPGGGPV